MPAPLRRAAVAGQFYPADPDALRAEVRGYLNAARPAPLDGPLLGVVVPHAGLMYSGPVAAYGYRALHGPAWDAVVLVGGSHHYPLRRAHVWATGAWDSPLGPFPIAETIAAELVAADALIVADPRPHEPEHALEVQLPFLAETLGLVPIVPVLVSPAEPDVCAALGRAIATVARDRRLAIVASTDLSHYHPHAVAQDRDRAAIDAICAWDPLTLARGSSDQTIEVCGGGAVAAAEIAAAACGGTHATLLHYANSGDVPHGAHDRVVGYAAIALLGSAATRIAELPPLTDAQGQRLVRHARGTLNALLLGNPAPVPLTDDPRFRARQSLFVTLRDRAGTLRGCIGRTHPPAPLAESIRTITEAAATRDPRFDAVRADELADLRVEVSVLSPPTPLTDPADLTIGRHGVVVSRGEAAGLLLPQVAPAQGWSVEAFLSGACQKAGLPLDAWRDPTTRLETFTAQVFEEPAPRSD